MHQLGLEKINSDRSKVILFLKTGRLTKAKFQFVIDEEELESVCQ